MMVVVVACVRIVALAGVGDATQERQVDQQRQGSDGPQHAGQAGAQERPYAGWVELGPGDGGELETDGGELPQLVIPTNPNVLAAATPLANNDASDPRIPTALALMPSAVARTGTRRP